MKQEEEFLHSIVNEPAIGEVTEEYLHFFSKEVTPSCFEREHKTDHD